jgi:serine/threonine-protein kinase
MTRPSEELILKLLMERGHLTWEAVDAVQAEFEEAATVVGQTAAEGRSLLDDLVAREMVAPELIAALELELDPLGTVGPGADDGFPIEGMDRFECIGILGAGGMGQVFKALDRELDRTVAIKFLHGSDPHMRRRFATEARAQAKISHPNVCEVYDVGELDGRQFIVMQFIDGGSLKETASTMPLERQVRLMRDVAAAVHQAHRTGLIHRDLKPGNIMVASGDDGLPTPYVVDFGIARDVAGPGVTMTGDLLGSPAFMAPEQARGGPNIDRRTDVYGLGATLYSVVTSRVPFRGETAFDTLMKVQLDDPDPPRKIDPSIPLDLESIVLKALEKEPKRRYQSAQDLADDLDRFLDGKPVAARPVGLGRRVGKWIARHRTLAASLLVLLVSAGLAIGYGLRAAAEARERQRLTLLFGTEAQRLDAMMRIAHLLPLHDTTPERDRIRARMEWIREQQKGVRGKARAPGWYALGRGHLVLDELVAARDFLRDAWDADFRSPDVAYAFGLTLGKIYRAQVRLLGEIRDPEEREARRLEIQSRYRDPAVELLAAATDVEGVEPTFVGGLLASFEGDHQRAIELARETIEISPLSYGAWLLQGEASLIMVQESRGRGDEEAAETFISLAEEGFTEAARLARSHPDAYSGLCSLWGTVMGMRLYGGGGDFETPLDRAVAACDRALAADPSRTEERHNKAICYRQRAEFAIRNGENPTEWLELARASIREILEIDPKDARAHIDLADSYSIALVWWTGLDKVDRTVALETVLEWSRLSVSSGEAAVELDPESVSSLRGLGTANLMRTDLLMAVEKDPRDSMQAAETAFIRAIELDPEALFSINNYAWALYQRGKYELQLGEDPRSALEECVRVARRAIEIKPNHITAINVMGRAQVLAARYDRTAGRDPTRSLDAAQETFAEVLEVNPDWVVGRIGLFWVSAERAVLEHTSGGDASESIARGMASAAELYGLPTARKEVRWDYANLSLLAAEREGDTAARRRLARRAAALFDEIDPADRFPEWDGRRELALGLSRE